LGRNSVSLGPIGTPQVREVVFNKFRTLSATLEHVFTFGVPKASRRKVHAFVVLVKSKSVFGEVLQPRSSCAAAAARPLCGRARAQNPPAPPPTPGGCGVGARSGGQTRKRVCGISSQRRPTGFMADTPGFPGPGVSSVLRSHGVWGVSFWGVRIYGGQLVPRSLGALCVENESVAMRK